MNRASKAARMAAATTPPAIPPICAWERLCEEVAAAVDVGVLLLVSAASVVVVKKELEELVVDCDVDVAVEVADEVVITEVDELVVLENVVLVLGTKTDPDTTTSVAVKVA